MKLFIQKLILSVCFLLALVILPAWAQTPAGQPLLTVSGKISEKNQGDEWVFDREMLEALPQVTVTTQTPWYDEISEFEGPSALSVLEKVGADMSADLRVYALNDYSAVVPISDLVNHGVIFAMKRNGEKLRVRDKGPLFIIYPFDSDPDLNSEIYYNRSVWQIKAIELY